MLRAPVVPGLLAPSPAAILRTLFAPPAACRLAVAVPLRALAPVAVARMRGLISLGRTGEAATARLVFSTTASPGPIFTAPTVRTARCFLEHNPSTADAAPLFLTEPPLELDAVRPAAVLA